MVNHATLYRRLRLAALYSLLILQSGFSLANDWQYTFRPGDTLWSVCAEFTREPGCWQKLGPLNSIEADRRIPPGTRIKIPVSWLKNEPASASVVFVQGDVRYQLPGGENGNAETGMQLPIGGKLHTGNGSATIRFADGSSMVLEANSGMTLDTLSNFEQTGMVDSSVRLIRGAIKTRVIEREPRSRVQTVTPSAVATVRGTEYRVNLEPADAEQKRAERTLLEVYQGRVDARAENKVVQVPARFGVITRKGEPPQEPVKLLTAPVFENLPEQFTVTAGQPWSARSPIAIRWQTLPGAQRYQLNVLLESDKPPATGAKEAKETKEAKEDRKKAGAENEIPEQTGTGETRKAEKVLRSYQIDGTRLELRDLSPACYQVSLRGIDQLGLQGLDSRKRFCLDERLASPKWRTPLRNSGEKEITLEWNAVKQARAYQLDIADNSDFDPVLTSQTTHDVSASLQEGSPVFVRVRALGSSIKDSPPSETLYWQPDQESDDLWLLSVPFGLYLLALVLI